MPFPLEMLLGRARPKSLTYQKWVSPAVINIAERLCARVKADRDSSKALDMLSRLASDERMRPVWEELYKKKRDQHHRPTEEFHHPACVTLKSHAARNRRRACELRKEKGPDYEMLANALEMEADECEGKPDFYSTVPWSEQDIAVQLFFWHAYWAALNCRPIFLSDLKDKQKKLHNIANQLRKYSESVQLLGQDTLAQKLEEGPSECESAARHVLPDPFKPGLDDPWIISRRRANVKLRTFIIGVSMQAETLFEKLLAGTVARVANVVFDRRDMTGPKVREMLRLPTGV